MKVTIESKKLKELLRRVMLVKSSKSTLPVLSMVRLTADNGRVSAEMTNLVLSVKVMAKCEVEECGKVLVSARRLADVAGAARAQEKEDDEEVSVELTGLECDGLQVRGRSWCAKLPGLDANELPPAEKESGRVLTEMPSGALRRMLKLAVEAVSTDATRYVLNGVMLHNGDGRVTAVSTDGRRLVYVDAKENGVEGDETFRCIVPPEAVRALVSILDDGEEPVRLTAAGAKALRVSLPDGGDVVTKLIEGNYPKYQQTVPKWEGRPLSLSRGDFMAMVARARVLAQDGGVSLYFEPDGRVRMASGAPDAGDWTEELPLYSAEGGPEKGHTVKVNSLYMAMLSAAESDGLQLMLGAAHGPLHFRATETAGGVELAAGWVLMPLRIEK